MVVGRQRPTTNYQLPTINSPTPTIAIIGAGAVGGYYGARLLQHGRDVHFLLRSDYDHVRRHGWTIRSVDGDFTLAPSQLNVYNNPAAMPKVDLVIVTLKATANDQYAPLITPLLHERTLILTLQNGLGNEEQLAALFGAERILGGLAFVCINRTDPGVIEHLDYGLIKLGQFIEGRTDLAAPIVEMFNACKISCQLLQSLREGRWEKLVWNIPFNGLGAALDLSTDRLINDPEGEALVGGIMAEVIAAANALGIGLSQGLIGQKIAQTKRMGAYRTSMQLDRHFARAMEVEAIVGAPLREAGKAHVETPRLHMLYQMLRLVNLGDQTNGR